MSNAANYQEEKWLEDTFMTPTIYLGLASDVATEEELEAGTRTNEITDYTGNRKALAMEGEGVAGVPDQNTDGKAEIANTAAVEFEDMPAITVKYMIICDSATGDNILAWLPLIDPDTSLPTTKVINAGDVFRVPIGAVVLEMD